MTRDAFIARLREGLRGLPAPAISEVVSDYEAHFAGGFVFAGGPFMEPPGGPLFAIFTGLGLMSGAICGGAILTLVSIGLVNATVWYGRLHYQLLKPAIEPR